MKGPRPGLELSVPLNRGRQLCNGNRLLELEISSSLSGSIERQTFMGDFLGSGSLHACYTPWPAQNSKFAHKLQPRGIHSLRISSTQQ